ncbi:MAG: bifunctional folylpolyglutamate synthase/dihydrofolate synthase, partial [Methylobacter sp.]
MIHFDSLQDWLKWQESLHPLVIDLGLERASQVFHALNPDYIKPPTITVAGTNGKGSTVAYLESIYTAQGYRVGAYTSPHILKYNERIKIDGKPVPDDEI